MRHLLQIWFIFVALWSCKRSNAERDSRSVRHQDPTHHRFLLKKTCSSIVPVISCSYHTGIFYKLNYGHLISVTDLSYFDPLSVPSYSMLSVSICNFENKEISSKTISTPIIPTIVNEIGEYAQVRVRFINSANVKVRTKLAIKVVASTTALIDTIINGTIGKGAAVEVSVKNSANVFLADGAEKLTIRNGQLLSGLFSATLDGPCVSYACLRGEITKSANVVGGNNSANVKIAEYGYLVGPGISTSCVIGGSHAVSIRSSANIRGVKSIRTQESSELVDDLIQTGEAQKTRLWVNITNTANVKVQGKLNMTDSFFVSSLVNVAKNVMTVVTMSARNVANSRAKSIISDGTDAFLDIADVRRTRQGRFKMNIRNAGNMYAKTSVTLKNGAQCIENAIDLRERTVDTIVMTSLTKSCNVWASKLRLKNGSNIVTSVLNVFNSGRSTYKSNVFHSANAFVTGRLHVGNGNLLRDFAIFRAAVGRVFVSVNSKHSASVHCTGGKCDARIGGGHLVANVLKIPKNSRARINARIHLENVGNMNSSAKGNPALVRHIFKAHAGAKKLEICVSNVGKARECKSENFRRGDLSDK